MAPLYLPGDYLLCRRPGNHFRLGDIVIARTPAYGKIIKRVNYVDPVKKILTLEGINPESVDSLQIGEIAFEDILWKVLFPLKRRKDRNKNFL